MEKAHFLCWLCIYLLRHKRSYLRFSGLFYLGYMLLARASASHLVEAVKLLYLGFPFSFPAHTNTRQFPLGSFFAFAIITPPYKDAALFQLERGGFFCYKFKS